MGPRWFERANDELEEAYERGEIDYGELHNEQRELDRELQDAALEEAEKTYRDYLGGY